MKNLRKPKAYEEPTGVNAREFVGIWQSSSSVAEVAKQVQRTKNAVRMRAFRYREMGVPLKQFPVVELVIDWDKLAEYAVSIETKQIAPMASVEQSA